MPLCLQVVSKIPVGGRPVHIYAIPELQTVWTHSDSSGSFDVVNITDASKLSASKIKV